MLSENCGLMLRVLNQLRQIFYRARGSDVQFDLSPYHAILGQINRHTFEGKTDDLLFH